MAPHTALLTLDILQEIFHCLIHTSDDELRNHTPPRGDRLALANLARSCKAFTEPALNALWSRLGNLTHILRLLPGFRKEGGYYVIDGVVTEQDWARFDFYANRVHHLYFIDHGEIHPSVYICLLLLRPSPLLPNLQSIVSCPGGSAKGGAGILMMLSSALVNVSILGNNSTPLFPEVGTCLEMMPYAAPMLRVLHVQTTLTRRSYSTFPRMTNLEALSLIGKGNTDAGFLSSLSALEHLHTLKFDIDDSEIDHADSNRPLPSSSFFPSLRTLEVFGPPPRIANSLAIFEEGHPLRQLKWESSSLGPQIDVPDLALWTSATRTIALKFPYLHDLKLKILTPRNFLSPAQAYFLEPLLELNFLEVLHLQFPWLSFSDAEFERMAVAWPHLRSLRLLGSSGIPKATISSLQSFAIHCPNLHSLSFAFDARQFKLPSPSVDEPISFSKLHTLDVQDSPVDDSLLLGRHLDRIFPNIIGIEGTDNPKIWAEVLTTINNLLLARSDQRAREEATRMNFSP